jgi:hypothetical protein
MMVKNLAIVIRFACCVVGVMVLVRREMLMLMDLKRVGKGVLYRSGRPKFVRAQHLVN